MVREDSAQGLICFIVLSMFVVSLAGATALKDYHHHCNEQEKYVLPLEFLKLKFPVYAKEPYVRHVNTIL